MKTTYDCIPCFIRQTLEAVRFATSNEAVHESVLREILSNVSTMDLQTSPPVMGQHIHRLIRQFTKNDDPYKDVKDRMNQLVLSLYPVLKDMVKMSSDKFDTAIRLSIAGNIIDFGVNTKFDKTMIDNAIESSISGQIFGSTKQLYQSIGTAKKILYLGDNAGEIVFDRIFIEQLPSEKIIFAVRGKPILNDATLDDAAVTGITDLVEVIDNGSDAPGTVLNECSEHFRQCFQEADIVISKGQGNYETLSNEKKNLFFLLKAKCPVIAKHIGCKIGDQVVIRPSNF